ncbi:MAG: hypothetical protein LUD12_10055 [Lachnospiraceae bacterium]|nr:hypothetical protein [Lachnospiraceae bacterium]
MEAIQVFDKNSIEHKKLELAAAMMTFLSPDGKRYRVAETWFDYGAGMTWTTILGESGLDAYPEYQALYPTQQKKVLESDSVTGILNAVNDIRKENRI